MVSLHLFSTEKEVAGCHPLPTPQLGERVGWEGWHWPGREGVRPGRGYWEGGLVSRGSGGAGGG